MSGEEQTITSFKVAKRNYGHWDIIDGNTGNRIFRLRGAPSKYIVLDERQTKSCNIPTFKTLSSAMSYICEILMFELIIVDGQKPQVIESWNL